MTTSSPEGRDRPPRERGLTSDELRLLAVLGLPTFAYALATTVATTYLPVLAADFTDSSTVVGMLIAIEGVMALLLAVPAGALSDRTRNRLPFVMVGTPVLVVALAVMGLSTSLGLAIVCVSIFFAAYFVAYEPYRAMYPDLVDAAVAGRGQSTQALWRGLGTVLAIASGGALLTLGNATPFVVGAVITSGAVGVFLWLVPRDPGHRVTPEHESVRHDLRHLGEFIAARPGVRAFMVANGLWELALGALKTFIILYLTQGLGLGTATAALVVAATAVLIAAATPISGKLADRFGTVPVMQISLLVYGLGLLVPFLVGDTRWAVGLATPIIAFGGGVVMTLPYALLIPLMGDGDHGLSTGLYSVSRGIGTALGPLLAGIAIGILDQGFFASTDGYAAVWGVCAAAILLSVPIVGRVGPSAAARN